MFHAAIVNSLLRRTGAVALCVAAAACGGGREGNSPQGAQPASGQATAPQSGSTASASGDAAIDVCRLVTAGDAAAVVGPLPAQPPSKTESVGFGIHQCLYVGPRLSGQGAQTVFTRLTVSAGSSKDAGDLLQDDADKRKATIDLPAVGDQAKRSAAGSFVWARRGSVVCTAEIANGLPAGLTADAAAAKLGALCGKVLAQPAG
jgi:hypothetical protein